MKIDFCPEPLTCDIGELCNGEVGYWTDTERLVLVCYPIDKTDIIEKENTCFCVDLSAGHLFQVSNSTQVIPMNTKIVLDE